MYPFEVVTLGTHPATDVQWNPSEEAGLTGVCLIATADGGLKSLRITDHGVEIQSLPAGSGIT